MDGDFAVVEPTRALDRTLDRLRTTFRSGRTRALEWRRRQLNGVIRLLSEREADVQAAVKADLGKGAAEALVAEILTPIKDARHALSKLSAWTKPQRASTPITAQPGAGAVVREPYGVVLIIGAWNFPVQLTLGPLIPALAAGNSAVVKPSEIAPATSGLLADLLPRYLDPDAVAVAEGGVAETTELLRRRFDFVFYTGNGRVGRIVARAAAEHLTPVALELGGKSPAVVLGDADLAVAARRLVWGRFMNAGQVCTAPDYVLVDRSVEVRLLEALSDAVRAFYGDDPQTSPDYGRIVSARHVERLAALMESGLVVAGGRIDVADRYVAPTILTGAAPDSPVMSEEIFGPILPVLPVDGLDEAVAFVNARDKPLAAYVFSADRRARDRFAAEISSGAVVGNDVIVHMTAPELPFGGVGESGTGAYHGRWGFELFSHRKAVMQRPTVLDVSLRYPPYTPGKLSALRRLM